jgi:FkbM family methyltransferase
MYHVAGFTDQAPVEFIFCDYPLLVPSKHVLAAFFDPHSQIYQPYRETGLVKIAQALQRLDRSGTAIDIGANVGDTCAILHRHCMLKIISIDASDFFFPYLAKNVERLFSDRATARQAFVLATRDETPRGLYHWGGTAKAVDAPFSEHCETIAICDLLGSVDEVALLKVDIDGFDIEVISGAFDNIGINGHESPRFPIYFEYEFVGDNLEQIRARCTKSLEFFRKAADAGYTFAFVWDDPGRFFGLIDIRNPTSIINAINYMGHFQHRTVYGYDICMVHQSDVAFASELCKVISNDSVMPVSIA